MVDVLAMGDQPCTAARDNNDVQQQQSVVVHQVNTMDNLLGPVDRAFIVICLLLLLGFCCCLSEIINLCLLFPDDERIICLHANELMVEFSSDYIEDATSKERETVFLDGSS